MHTGVAGAACCHGDRVGTPRFHATRVRTGSLSRSICCHPQWSTGLLSTGYGDAMETKDCLFG